MSVLGTIGLLTAGSFLGNLFGKGSSDSSASGYQQTQVTPAPRSAEGKVIWADFMKQLYGSGYQPPQLKNTIANIMAQVPGPGQKSSTQGSNPSGRTSSGVSSSGGLYGGQGGSFA